MPGKPERSHVVDLPTPMELKDFNRTLAEIEWLLLVLVLVFLALPNSPVEHPLHVLGAGTLFALFIVSFRYLNLLTIPARWKFTIETWAMLALTAVAVWNTGKVESPLFGLSLLVIVFSALTLGKLITLLEVALIASFYLYAAYAVHGQAIYGYETFSRLMLSLAPYVLVAYVTSLLAADFGFSRLLVQRQADTDPLTGLPTMRAFNFSLAHQRREAQLDGRSFSLLMIDIDALSAVNARDGHDVGNQVIRDVAQAIARSIRTADLAARYSGDTFIVLLPHTGPREARRAAERVRDQVQGREVRAHGRGIRISVSIGFSSFPAMASDVDQLIRRADEALAASKRAGRDGIRGYDEPDPVGDDDARAGA